MEYGLPVVPRSSRTKTVATAENVAAVTTLFEKEPRTSTRSASRSLGISRRSIQRILKDQKFHPYKLRLHQQLEEEDFSARMEFAQEMLQMLEDDPTLLDSLVFSDEANFHLSGVVNRHNAVYWDASNPDFTATLPVNSPKVTVWCGIWSGGVFGPFFFDDNVTSASYLAMLSEWLMPQLRRNHLFVHGKLWYQQDGAPPHWGRAVREFLDQQFGEQWIGRSGPIQWPARSPDLTPLDYWMWGYLKNMVYQNQASSLVELKALITQHVTAIQADMRRRAITAFRNRLKMLIEADGDAFEN
jgi:hypothetical protein